VDVRVPICGRRSVAIEVPWPLLARCRDLACTRAWRHVAKAGDRTETRGTGPAARLV